MKLKNITVFGNNVKFVLDNGETISYEIFKSGGDERCFLNLPGGLNNYIFDLLGISEPSKLYKELGIYIDDGVCPYCHKKDFPKLFDYLLQKYGIKDEPVESKPDHGEWEWILG